MPVTGLQRDKFAFLFSGLTDTRYISDLEKVYNTLIEYYNFIPDNIWVVQGVSPFAGTFNDLPAANQIVISTDVELKTAFDIFAQYVQTNDVNLTGDEKNTAFVYITGDGTTVTGQSKLIINDIGDYVDTEWFTKLVQIPFDPPTSIVMPYLEKSQVSVIMQQSYSGGFLTSLQDSDLLEQRCFISACGSTETSDGDATGGYFTDAFTIALRQNEALPPTHPTYPDQYADQLDAANDALLVSFGEAVEFAAAKNSATNYTHNNWGEAYKYIGKPVFYIRDGDPQWWESPDIYLTHPNHPTAPAGDLYIPDAIGSTAPYNNTICINMRNTGTHPVRCYSMGIELFKTGAGATNEQLTVTDRIPTALVMKPILVSDIGTAKDNPDTHEWNTPFYEGLRHECVRAEGKLLAADVDFVWNYRVNDFEAQVNTDEMTVVPPSPPPPEPDPGSDETPEPEPGDDFKGTNENSYAIKNPFDEDKKFIIVFPREYIRYKNRIKINWFEVPEKLNSEVGPLEVINEGFYFIPLDIKAKQKKELIFQLSLHPKFKFTKPIRLPFEILVEGKYDQPLLNFNPLNPGVDPRKFAPLSGITVVIKKGCSTIKGMVLDNNKKPVPDAIVYLRTFNGRKVATVRTDKKGKYILKEISPNNYFLKAEADGHSSEEKVTFLTDGKVQDEILMLTKNEPIEYKNVKVILDKVRILNDHDYGRNKGEIIFTSMVMPDNDLKARQKTRLPEDGFFKVSDKPGENEIEIGKTIFEGKVRNNHLSISIGARDYDYHINPDDPLKRYYRVFTGDPDNWYGEYKPGDEIMDKERLSDWLLWFSIVKD